MKDTYKAVEVSAPGVLRVVEWQVSEPRAGSGPDSGGSIWNLSHRCRHGQQTIDQVLMSLSFGGGAVNEANIHVFIESMPFGGIGSSGIGNYYGKYGVDSFTHAKSILVAPPDVSIGHLFSPYSVEKVRARNQWFD